MAAGGNFGSGFLAAGFGSLAGPLGLQGGKFNTGNLIAGAALGGIGSVLGGGKFANGAITGAFAYAASASYSDETINGQRAGMTGVGGGSILSNPACPADSLCLLVQTVSGGPGGNWEARFVLTQPTSEGGWVIQTIDRTGIGATAYDEAWYIGPGKTSTGFSVDDLWQNPAGNTVITGSARFYPGLNMNIDTSANPAPSAWQYNNPRTNAGGAPSAVGHPPIPISGFTTPPVTRTSVIH